MRIILILIFTLMLQGCVLVTNNYILNKTDTDLIVSVQVERPDLGWERKERKKVIIKKQSICNIVTEVFYKTYIYIKNPNTGNSTNINLIEADNYIYTVSTDNNNQVVTITEADRKTKKSFINFRDQCIPISNEKE